MVIWGVDMKKIFLMVTLILLNGCTKQPEKTSISQADINEPKKELTQEEKDRAFLEKIAAAPNLEMALKLASPQLGNQYQKDDRVSLGANGLVWWSEKNLTWGLINKLPSTTYLEFRKDSFLEAGKKICANVSVSEISAVRNKESTSYYATLKDRKNFDQIFQAVLLKSTKGINENSKVRVCGIAVENYQYKNIANGFTNSVFIIGLFDLPENR